MLPTCSSYSIGGGIVVTEPIDHQQMQPVTVAPILKTCWRLLVIGGRAVALVVLVV